MTDLADKTAKAEIPDPETLQAALPAAKTRKIRKDKGKLRIPRKINADKVLQLKSQGMNNYDIAKHQGVTPSAVWKFLDKNSNDYKDLEIFKDHSATVHLYDRFKVRKQRERIVNSIESTEDKEIAELSLDKKGNLIKALAVTEGIMEDKEMDAREGRQQAQSYHQINISMGEIEKELAAIESERA